MGRKIISISIIASLTASFAFFIVPPRSAYAAIAFDAASSAAASTAASSLTFPHTVASGNSRLLIVGVTIADTSNAVATVTYGGTSMISLGVASRGAGKPEVSLWYLVAPATGANNVVVTLTSGQTDRMMAGAVSFTNVHQSTPVGTFFSAASKASPATVGVTGTNLGDVVIDIIGNMDPAAGNTLAVGANQTERWQGSTGSGSDQVLGGMSTESSSGG
ncbi:MAG: hypothetical protein Q7R94_02040, partial [bacterium]|nr:hypothetical protein [bacterium]